MIHLLLAVLLVMLAVMTAGWLTVRVKNDGGWTDVFWTFGTGATCALAALVPLPAAGAPNARQVLVAVLVAVWALRLGGYILVRVSKGPEDARYVELKKEWGEKFIGRMFGLLIVQAPITACLAVSVLFAARDPAPDLRLRDFAGALVLIAAILGESLADGQMKRFKADPDNKGKVADTGLWGWSRHPNYLFEALGWFAYPVIALDLEHPATWLAFLAPTVMLLILRYATGVPPLERAMVASRGDAYRRYQSRVSPFLPRPPKKDA